MTTPSKTEHSQSNLSTTETIIQKWRAQGGFIRFKDGNPGNCAATNLEYVDLTDALNHIDDWKVDWDINLTEEEINVVRDPAWRAGLSFK